MLWQQSLLHSKFCSWLTLKSSSRSVQIIRKKSNTSRPASIAESPDDTDDVMDDALEDPQEDILFKKIQQKSMKEWSG